MLLDRPRQGRALDLAEHPVGQLEGKRFGDRLADAVGLRLEPDPRAQEVGLGQAGLEALAQEGGARPQGEEAAGTQECLATGLRRVSVRRVGPRFRIGTVSRS